MWHQLIKYQSIIQSFEISCRIEQLINKQTEYAVEKADIVLFVIDGKQGLTNADIAIASYFLCLFFLSIKMASF